MMQPPTSKTEVWDRLHTWFDVADPQTVEIHSDFSVTVHGDLDSYSLTPPNQQLPLVFREITGTCVFVNMGLETLAGSPAKCGSFSCAGNQLTSLVGGPTSVLENYMCGYNQLTDLKGAPEIVPGSFVCWQNSLTSLDGCPRSIGGKITVDYSPDMPLLRTLVANKIELEPAPDPILEIILNKYAGQGRAGAIDCKRELVAAGFEGNARW